MARNEQGEKVTTDVVLLVCMKCGRELQLEGDEERPSDLKCEKCGNQVFRVFDDTGSPEEAVADFRDSTERDTATDDPAEDTTRQDLLDLNNP